MSNTDTLDSMYASFQSGNIDFVVAQMADEVEWDLWTEGNALQDAGYPLMQHRQGPGGVRDFFTTAAKTIEMLEFEPLPMMTSDDGRTVASPVRMRYRFQSSGKEVVEDVWHIWTFDDEGKVVELRHLMDTAKHLANWRP